MALMSPVSAVTRFVLTQNRPARYLVTGQTQDASSAPLAGCTVNIFETGGLLRGSVVSDANGNYSFDVTGGSTFFAVAYSADGSLVGATVNTIAGTAS